MTINKESNAFTIMFAIILVVVVGTGLSAWSNITGPNIKINQLVEKQQNILYAIGVNENGDNKNAVKFISSDKSQKEFEKYITNQIHIEGDTPIDNPNAYLIDVKKEKALAKDPDYKRKLPLFTAIKDGDTLYVAPIRGKGLWDAIWAYVAIDKKMVVRGIYFDHKAEICEFFLPPKARVSYNQCIFLLCKKVFHYVLSKFFVLCFHFVLLPPWKYLYSRI